MYYRTIKSGPSVIKTTMYLKVPTEVKVLQTISLKETNKELMKKCKQFTKVSTAPIKN